MQMFRPSFKDGKLSGDFWIENHDRVRTELLGKVKAHGSERTAVIVSYHSVLDKPASRAENEHENEMGTSNRNVCVQKGSGG